MAQIKANEHLYTRFRVALEFKKNIGHSLDEITEEVEKYEEFKREQGF